MKRILVLLLFVSSSFSAMAQGKKVIWNYPVKPGTEAWKAFDSNEAMVKACRIPEKVLLSLPTEDLTELCLAYPLLYDVFAFNSFNDGLDKLCGDFNGIKELFGRRDATQELLKRYSQKMQNLSLLKGVQSNVEKGLFIISISALEVLLCRCELQNETVKDNTRIVLQNLVSGYEKKAIYAEYFQGFGFQTNIYSRAHIISKMNAQNLERLSVKEQNAVLFSGMVDGESMRVLDELSYRLIK